MTEQMRTPEEIAREVAERLGERVKGSPEFMAGVLMQRLNTAIDALNDAATALRTEREAREHLQTIVDRAAAHWLSLEPGVTGWQGDLADAMGYGVAEIVKLRKAREAETRLTEAALTLVDIRTKASHEALARAEKAEAERDRYEQMMRHMVPMSDDGNSVFIDGAGDVEIDHDRKLETTPALEARATAAEGALATARNDALREVAEWVRPQRNDVPATGDEFASAILALIQEPSHGK